MNDDKWNAYAKKWNKYIVRYMILAAALVLCVLHLSDVLRAGVYLVQISKPLVVGLCMAYIMNVLVIKLENIYFPNSHKKAIILSRRPVCALGSLVLIVAMFVLLIRMIIPGLIQAVELIAQAIPHVFQELQVWINEEGESNIFKEILRGTNLDWEGIQKNILSLLGGDWQSVLSSTVSAVGTVSSFLMQAFLAVIFALFLLINKEKLHRQVITVASLYIPEKRWNKIHHGFTVAHKVFSSFIIGQCVSALVLGGLCTLGMMIFGMPYAVIGGVITGTTALIPIIGAYAGAILTAFLVFTIDPMQAIWFLVFITVLQQIEGNLIYPRLMGSTIGLPSMWVLVGVTIGGGLLGVGGMLLGVPLIATFYALAQEGVRAKIQKKEEQSKLLSKEKPACEK